MADATLFHNPPTLSATITQASWSNDAWASAKSVDGAIPLIVNEGTIRLVSHEDDAYPARLRLIEFPPSHLYILGAPIESRYPPLAIVGSRHPSQAGIRAATDIAASLAHKGHTIVSGLASGIDAAAHKGALDASGHTIAVVGTGADCVYPAENQALRDEIARSGTIISQFPLGHGPSKTTFPARNALIAGLSAASLLVELTERSGTRIQANLTLEQNKPVLLWEPILGNQQWARSFAQHPLVSFVSSVESIAKTLDSTNQ